MKLRTPSLSRMACATCLVLGLGITTSAAAANHALIMWIGDYGSQINNLPGIDLDAANARLIAGRLNVPASNVREISNAALTHAAIDAELQRLASTVQNGDNVFLYFSGHGRQVGKGAGGCSEGMVPRDVRNLYPDEKLSPALAAISAKAGQVIMFNDSCFSGGAATKSAGQFDATLVPKYWQDDGADKSASAYVCGDAVNKNTRNLFVSAAGQGNNMLYVAASADNEVAAATTRGSLATLAWTYCLQSNAADTNRSGGIDGQELQACAQEVVRNARGNQTITLAGNQRLPLTFSSVPVASSSTTSNQPRVDVRQALEDLRASAAPSLRVSISSNTDRLRIKQDFLDFTVSTSEAGYLYLLHVGSDGKTYNLLLPNQIDNAHYVQAGEHRFPRDSWRLQAGGPAGTSHVMAMLTKRPRSFERFMQYKGAIADAPVDTSLARNLIITSGNTDSGRYGVSNILSLQEY